MRAGSVSDRSDPVDLEELARTTGEWMKGSGPESDVVISSRIRLARNLADHPFITRATPADRIEIERTFRDAIQKSGGDLKLSWVDVAKLEGLDRQFLVERQLISREHADSEGARGVAIDDNEQTSLMINEEDHLRIQVL